MMENSEMTKQNSYADLLNAPPASRKKVAEAEDLYDQHYEIRPGKIDRLPARRRLRRIAVYKSIIGYGHQAILELGCGPGDLIYALVDHAEKIVGTDICECGRTGLIAKKAVVVDRRPNQENRIQANVRSRRQLSDVVSQWIGPP
jgi:SAM-dependent methyltransferase